MKDEVVRRARARVGSCGIKASQTESKRSKRFAESGAEALSRSRGIHGATGKRGMTPQARGGKGENAEAQRGLWPQPKGIENAEPPRRRGAVSAGSRP
jgi:hypothetical protein